MELVVLGCSPRLASNATSLALSIPRACTLLFKTTNKYSIVVKKIFIDFVI
jgi:hypothetical protein